MNGNNFDAGPARPIISTNNNHNNYIPYEETEKEEINLKPKRRLFRRPGFVGTFFAIIGILVGGLGCFGIIKMAGEKSCDCPKVPVPVSATALNTNFLRMELDSKNILYSPLSIRYGLALLDAGAAGETRTQIEDILGDDDLPMYDNVQDKLSLVNAVFIKASYKDNVLPSYIKKVTTNYNAEVLYDSFTSSENMDNWVNGKTFGLIKTIGVQPNINTQMVLANALAIQLDWQYKFDTDNTFGMTFYKEDDSEIIATTMKMDTKSADISYYKGDDATMLQMPLETTNETALEFVAVMPAGDLTSYIENLDFDTIESALQNMTPASTPEDGLKIYIPKFKFDYELDFKNDLEKMGMTDAFSAEDADFSRMAVNNDLFVSDAVHKANIDFSEEGIKAAAVTAFAMDIKSLLPEKEPQPVVINIDKPFYFMIYDKNNGTTWFSGVVYEPNLWENDMTFYQAS